MEAAHHPWPAVGALLVRDGLISEADLEAALVAQRGSGKRLGEVLVERGMVTRTQVARVLAEQHELPFIELAESEVQVEAATLLTEDLARRYSALPVSILPDDSLLVAVADPTNVMHSDELRLALGVPLRFGVAAPDAIEAAIAFIHQHALTLVDDDAEEAAAAAIGAHACRGQRPALGRRGRLGPACGAENRQAPEGVARPVGSAPMLIEGARALVCGGASGLGAATSRRRSAPRTAASRPSTSSIAGTRPRGVTAEDDARLEVEAFEPHVAGIGGLRRESLLPHEVADGG